MVGAGNILYSPSIDIVTEEYVLIQHFYCAYASNG